VFKKLAAVFLAATMFGGLAIGQEKATEQKAEKKMESKNPIVEIQTNHGNIYLEVFEKETPIHARNFLSKVDAGKYDSLTFHRIAKKQDGSPFVIQGGDPTGTGSGSMGEERLADEKSPYPEVRGTVAMARSQLGASNCQFYINMADNTFLDRQNFSAFAKVVKGIDVAEKIMQVQTGPNDRPTEPVVMLKLKRVDSVPSGERAKQVKDSPKQK
jgi:cyclophilin family peptidyl-prolyl cis-trans isomerase